MKQPEELVFFIDRALGRKIIAERLRADGARVEIHDDHFPVDCTDALWLSEVGKRGWVVLTKDRNFQRREVEIVAIARSGARVFQLTAAGIQGSEMAEIFARALRKMTRISMSNRAPFIARVTRRGSVYLVFTHRKLQRYGK